MSFSSDVKNELTQSISSACCYKAEAFGMLIFGRSFSFSEISLMTEIKEIAERYGINVIEGTVISVPSNKAFSDNWLHPNEIGFEMMANGIIKHLKRNDNL